MHALVQIPRDGADRRQRPGDGAEALDEVADREADAALGFCLSSGADAHEMRLGDDAHERLNAEHELFTRRAMKIPSAVIPRR